jgi:hypothetical protein
LGRVGRRGLIIGCLIVLLAAGIPAATSGAQKEASPSTDTPLEEGEGRDLVIEKCTTCHDLERVPAKRRDKYGWEDLVDNMRSRGAEMTAEERQKIVDYLTAHYGIPD